MPKDSLKLDDLSIEELEAILARKKLEARGARLRRFRKSGRALRVRREVDPQVGIESFRTESETKAEPDAEKAKPLREGASKLLLAVEVAAVLGLLFVLFSGVGAVQSLNQEVAEARLLPSPTPLITAVVLPSGHTPPTSPGGARPNEAEIPAHLRPLVQSMPAPEIPKPSPGHAQRVQIPALWDSPAPVVQGDGWEQLKKGVGQHIGTANPGEVGNVVLSAHNDIFGELFRYLDRLKPGDEIILSTGAQNFVYRVTGTRIVEPTEVSVMEPTARATVTLISCYPYLIDSERIVVFGELVDS
ncbi:MAG: class D sortase [Chloroflexi bacterium]|nr:class D sortase [Chloroflexota bacterium]